MPGRTKKERRVIAKVMGPKKRKAQGPNGIVTKKFSLLDPQIVTAGGAYTAGADTFELADMPQFAAYVALYEQFKITKIVYHFRSLNPQQSIGAAAVGTLGYLHTVIDYNDATVPAASAAGIQNMMNDTDYKGVKSNRDLTRTIRPMFLTQAGTQTAKSVRGWLNCRDLAGAVNAVSHYGIKWVIQGGLASAPNAWSCVYDPIITYYVQFKNPQ